MKKNSYIGISFIVLLFGIIFIPRIINRINTNSIIKNDRLNNYEKVRTKDTTLVLISKIPSFELTDQNGKKISDKSYLGKVFIVEFFFANCLTICPVMNKNLVQFQDEFYGNLDFGIASITIDPEHDTPAFLKEHAKTLGVKHTNWHFLSGDSDYIMNLANKGFYIQAGKDAKAQGGFGHSGQFALIDKEGNIRSRKDKFGNPILFYDGLEQIGIDALKQDIKLLLKE